MGDQAMRGAVRRAPDPDPLPAEDWEDGCMTTAEVAEFLGASRRTVYEMTRRGDLAYGLLGNQRRYPRKRVVQLLSGGTRR